MRVINQMKLEILSVSANVAFARSAVAAFATQIECTLSDVEEIKVAVSEAVENAIIHGYEHAPDRFITIYTALTADTIEIRVEDAGKGIEQVDKAVRPAFTTESERLGLGFVFMESFMDSCKVESFPAGGTVVTMRKRVGTGVVRIEPEQ